MKSLRVGIAAVLLAGAMVSAVCSPVSGQGTWETTLQARDLTGDGVADAFYDTVLDITWLRDTKLAAPASWEATILWVNGLVVGGQGGWRLPTMVDTGPLGCDYTFAGSTDCGFNVQTISADGIVVYSEMATLWYETLGNLAFCAPGDGLCTPGVPRPGSGLSNTGDFQGLEAGGYWSDLRYGLGSTDGVWYFGSGDGQQAVVASKALLYGMAVHPGDVGIALVPEPQTLMLVLVGFAGLGLSRRRCTT